MCWSSRPPAAARRQVGEHPAVVLECDLELVALEEDPVFVPTEFGGEFPLTRELEDGAAFVGFQDSLRFAR